MNYKQLKSVLFGLAVGDALGVPFEFCERGSFECTTMVGFGTHFQPAGTWSDDTSMALATLDSLIQRKSVDVQDMRQKYLTWLSEGIYTPHGRVFDVGLTTSQALVSGQGRDDFYSNGNGSLMRIAPLAFFPVSSKDIASVSAITHAHPISQLACIIFIEVLKGLLEGKDINALLAKRDYPSPFDRLNKLDRLPKGSISSSGYVVDSLEASIWCLVQTKSFEEAVLLAVNHGDDTDTIAAITGALAGAVYGFDAIPSKWLEDLQNSELIDDILSGYEVACADFLTRTDE